MDAKPGFEEIDLNPSPVPPVEQGLADAAERYRVEHYLRRVFDSARVSDALMA